MRLTDTNILLYAISVNPSEAAKKVRALEVLGEDSLAISVQVMAEFYHQATRRSRPGRLTHDGAMEFLDRFAEIPVQPVTIEIFHRATELCNRYRISYWDAAILASAAALGCDAVYSEDMSDRQDYDGIRVINPFAQQTA